MTVKISKTPKAGEPKAKRTKTTAAEPAEKKLHAWIDGSSGAGRWHYCEVCRAVRHPNGKLDEQACPGPYKRPKPAARKVSPVSTSGPLGSAAPITPSVRPGASAPAKRPSAGAKPNTAAKGDA